MTYLSHSASFHSKEQIAPSNRGIKHLAASSRRQADYTYSVLALILAWALDRGKVPRSCWQKTDPEADGRDVYESQEAFGRFVVAGGDAAGVFELVEAPLDKVAQ